MLFTEGVFLPFCALTLLLYWRVRNERARKLVLLIASYIFYGAWDWRFLSLLALSTLVDYVLAIRIASSSKVIGLRLLTLSLTYNLTLLGFFKYYNFFAGSFADLAERLGWSVDSLTLQIVLPVGISFFTFQSLSYTIDVYRRELQPARSLLDFAMFIAFFPQLVAGPIVRASDFLKQLPTPRTAAHVDLYWSMSLFLVGFVKKACVADNLSRLADAFYHAPTAYTVSAAWVGVSAYAVQIYCDFSGYSDMAIAVAGLFGYMLRSNFEAPYLATDITDFWRRWHISLSSWLRDYVYIPLGGGRQGVFNTHRNLMITMVLGGLWHGASWNFIIWGAMHGVALIIHKEWTKHAPFKLPAALGWALTLCWVALAWIPFRAQGFQGTRDAVSALLGGGTGTLQLARDGGFSWLLVFVALLLAHSATYFGRAQRLSSRLPWWQWGLGYGACWALALAARKVGYVPFVYFQF